MFPKSGTTRPPTVTNACGSGEPVACSSTGGARVGGFGRHARLGRARGSGVGAGAAACSR
jgi:hypothetical protein